MKLIAEADYGILTADGTDTTWIAEDNVALEGGRMAFFVQSVHNKTGTADFEVTSPGMETAELCIYIEPFRAENLVPVAAGR